MPFYIRKSLSFGPIRFNLSKSGVGVSAGIKGFRVGGNSKGNYVHMGRGGLYYRATLSSNKKGKKDKRTPKEDYEVFPKPSDLGAKENIEMEAIDSGDIGEIVDSSSAQLVDEINGKQKKLKLLNIYLCISIALLVLIPLPDLYKSVLFLLFLIGIVPLHLYDKARKTTVIFYEIDKDVESLFKAVYEAFEEVSKCCKIWHISAKGDINNSKYHGGANQAISRKEIKVQFNNPKFIKTNIPTPSLQVGSQTIYFFPDKILMFEKKRVGGLSYENVTFSISSTLFVEEERVPKDTKVVDQTWLYVNKKGGPDKRFKDNKQIPVVEYEQVHFSSNSGLNECINLSKIGCFIKVEQALKAIASITN